MRLRRRCFRSDDVLDMNTIAELRRLSVKRGDDFAGRVIRLYLNHAPSGAAEIAILAKSDDFEALAKAAHSLKSMSLNIGARSVATFAARLEREAESGIAPDETDLSELQFLVDITSKRLCVHLAQTGEAA
jgi:HPt (histidine-containing phosphotransfer) domain-containing protein